MYLPLNCSHYTFLPDCRCSDCWLSRPDCICAKLPRLQLSDNINEIIVYMDPKEMYNAGDDAKLLLISAPLKTKRFIYGLEDDELCTHLGSCKIVNSNDTLSHHFPK